MKLSYGLDTNYVDSVEYVVLMTLYRALNLHFSLRVAQKVVAGVYQGVTTVELDVSESNQLHLYLSHYEISRTWQLRQLHILPPSTPTMQSLLLGLRYLTCTRKPRKTFLKL